MLGDQCYLTATLFLIQQHQNTHHSADSKKFYNNSTNAERLSSSFPLLVPSLIFVLKPFKGGSKNYHRKDIVMNMANVLSPFVLFPVQSASSFGHNARIAPSLTGTLSSKIEQNLARLIFRTTLIRNVYPPK